MTSVFWGPLLKTFVDLDYAQAGKPIAIQANLNPHSAASLIDD